MSQLIDVQAGAPWLGDWGTSPAPGPTNNSPPVVKTGDNTMLYLTAAGVILAALMYFKKGR